MRLKFSTVVVLLKFTLLLKDDIVLEWWEVGADLHLDLLLSHFFEFSVLIIHRQPLTVVDIAQLVVLPPVVFLFLPLAFLVVCLEILFKCLVLAETGVESVLDVVVDSTGHELLYLDPLVAVLLVQLHQLQVLGDGPLGLVEIRVDVVVPAFATLLSDASRQEGCYLLPLFQAELLHLLAQNHVLFGCPVTLDLLNSAITCVVAKLQPAIHALNFALVEPALLQGVGGFSFLIDELVQQPVDDFDVFDLVRVDELHQLAVFVWVPVRTYFVQDRVLRTVLVAGQLILNVSALELVIRTASR